MLLLSAKICSRFPSNLRNPVAERSTVSSHANILSLPVASHCTAYAKSATDRLFCAEHAHVVVLEAPGRSISSTRVVVVVGPDHIPLRNAEEFVRHVPEARSKGSGQWEISVSWDQQKLPVDAMLRMSIM